MPLIYQTAANTKSQTKQSHRYTLQFNGLDAVMNRAKNSPLQAVRNRYTALEPAFLRAGWSLAETLELGLLSVQVPQIQIASEDVHRFNDSFKQLTKFEPIQEFQVVFYDFVNGSASAIINAWWALCGEKGTGAIGYKEDYLLESARFKSFGPQAPAEDVPVAHDEYDVISLYPTNVDLGEHSYENGAVRRVTCSFVCDNFVPIAARPRQV